MSISSVGVSSAYTAAVAKLKVDQQKLVTDQKSKATGPQLQADGAAISKDAQAVARDSQSGSTGSPAAGAKPAVPRSEGSRPSLGGVNVYA